MLNNVLNSVWYKRALKIEQNLFNNGWTYIGRGKNRRVWKLKNKNFVLKIAYTDSGIIANKNEHTFYRNSNRINFAACRLICDNILMMRAVSILDDSDFCQYKLIPSWAFNLNDGPQVGIDRNGMIVAYDYAEEVN